MKARKTKVLVTGAAGFIGRHVTQKCLDLGMQVVGLDDLSGGFQSNLPAGVEFIRGSIADDTLVRNLTEAHSFRFIYHLAAYAAEGLSHFIRRFNYQNNLTGSVTLINAAVRTKVECFVFTSSIAVYGKNQLPMTESLEPCPEDPYGISKYAVELDLRAARQMFGLNSIVFRPHNVYGPYQNIADRYRNVIGIFMNQILQGKPLTLFGDGSQKRAFTYVDDIAPTIASAPLNPRAHNETFNLGADTPYTVLELAKMVAAAFGEEPRLQHLPPRNEVHEAYSDHRKVRAFFPPQNPPTDLATGLLQMARWVKEHGPREPVTFDPIEIEEKLPSSWKTGGKETDAAARHG